MVTDDEYFAPQRLATAELPGRHAAELFRETFSRTILGIDVQPLADSALEADIMLRAFCGLRTASGQLSPMRARHAPDLIENDDLVLVIIRSGHTLLEQDGRAVEVGPGQVVLTDNGVPGTFTGHTPVNNVNLRFRRALLAPHIADLGRALLTPLIENTGALDLLKSYANFADSDDVLAKPGVRRAVARHMYDLAVLAIGAKPDAAELAKNRGIKAARLQAIKSDIARNVGDMGLSADAVAGKHGITSRYLRTLFEDEGMSFSEYVLGRRLQRAYYLLTDPENLPRPISSIAFDCGFSDLSYFNRTFRRHYDMTPSDARASARGR